MQKKQLKKKLTRNYRSSSYWRPNCCVMLMPARRHEVPNTTSTTSTSNTTTTNKKKIATPPSGDGAWQILRHSAQATCTANIWNGIKMKQTSRCVIHGPRYARLKRRHHTRREKIPIVWKENINIVMKNDCHYVLDNKFETWKWLTCSDPPAERSFRFPCWYAPREHAWRVAPESGTAASTSSTARNRASDTEIPPPNSVYLWNASAHAPIPLECNDRCNRWFPQIANRKCPSSIRRSDQEAGRAVALGRGWSSCRDPCPFLGRFLHCTLLLVLPRIVSLQREGNAIHCRRYG